MKQGVKRSGTESKGLLAQAPGRGPESSPWEVPGPRMFGAVLPAPLALHSPVGSPSGHLLLTSLLYSAEMN